MQIKHKFKQLKTTGRNALEKIFSFVRNNLYLTLGGIFLVLLALIIAGNILRNNQKEKKATREPIPVQTYQIGSVPKVELVGEVEKENVVTIVAQTSGIVQNIYATEGDYVASGRNLAYLSTNYQGGNATSIQRQIAEKQYKNVQETYQTQLDLINKQKEIAEKTAKNSKELREINQQSVKETENLINLNEEIINYLDENIDWYEATNSADRNRSLIAQTKQLKSNYQSGLNQLKSSLRKLKYNTNENNPPAELSNLQKQTTVKQLELQKKSLQLNKEISRLQYQLAQVNESLSFPASFTSGTIQKVHIKKGQSASPGMPLFTIKGENQSATINVSAPKKIAQNVSDLERSQLIINQEAVELFPQFVSSEATKGTLYNIKYILPKEYALKVTNGENLKIKIPVGYPETGSAVPFVPIDSVYQTNDDSFVFLAENGTAVSKNIQLGEVFGSFVAVRSGLQGSNQVILNRNIVDGDPIKVEN